MPDNQANTTQPKAQANEWFHDGDWKQLHQAEKPIAHNIRQALIKLCLYPTTVFEGHTQNNTHEANYRAVLHRLADELDSDDLLALSRAARLLYLVERDLEPFKEYSTRSSTMSSGATVE